MIVFIDNILIYSRSEEEHEGYLRLVLEVLREKKLYAKLSMGEFWMKEVKFLGHVVSGGRIVVDPSKMKAMMSWKRPTIVTNL